MFYCILSFGQKKKILSKRLIEENLLEYTDSTSKYPMAYRLYSQSPSNNISLFFIKEDSLIKEIRIQSKGNDIGIINISERKLELLPNMKISNYYSCKFQHDTLFCNISLQSSSYAVILIFKEGISYKEIKHNSKELSQIQYYFDKSIFLRLEKKKINK